MNPVKNSIDIANPLTLNLTVTGDDVPARTVLEETSHRALVFLKALGTQPPLRGALAAAGYKQADHAEGWNLVFLVMGHGDTGGAVGQNAATQAIEQIDAWEQAGFVRAQAALRHKHPDQGRFVFGGGLSAGRGAAAVAPLVVFLDRLDALENAPERKATRKADHAALATLAARGIDDKLRKQLRILVDAASIEADASTVSVPVAQQDRVAGLVSLYRWYEDWSATARAVITRRGDLITLGLAKRRTKKAVPAVVVPAPSDGTPAIPPNPITPAPTAPTPIAPAVPPPASPTTPAAPSPTPVQPAAPAPAQPATSQPVQALRKVTGTDEEAGPSSRAA